MPVLARLLGLFRRRAEPAAAAVEPGLRNYSEAVIRAEFKRRYLVEFAGYVGRDRVASEAAGANFLLFAAMLGGTALAGPIAGLVGGGLALRQLWAARATKAPRRNYRIARASAAGNFDKGDSGAGKDFIDCRDDRHISDSRTVCGR